MTNAREDGRVIDLNSIPRKKEPSSEVICRTPKEKHPDRNRSKILPFRKNEPAD